MAIKANLCPNYTHFEDGTSGPKHWILSIDIYKVGIKMMWSLFYGIIIGFLINSGVKQLKIDKYWSFSPLISSVLVNNISPSVMANPHSNRLQYNRKQLLDYSFVPRRLHYQIKKHYHY